MSNNEKATHRKMASVASKTFIFNIPFAPVGVKNALCCAEENDEKKSI